MRGVEAFGAGVRAADDAIQGAHGAVESVGEARGVRRVGLLHVFEGVLRGVDLHDGGVIAHVVGVELGEFGGVDAGALGHVGQGDGHAPHHGFVLLRADRLETVLGAVHILEVRGRLVFILGRIGNGIGIHFQERLLSPTRCLSSLWLENSNADRKFSVSC